VSAERGRVSGKTDRSYLEIMYMIQSRKGCEASGYGQRISVSRTKLASGMECAIAVISSLALRKLELGRKTGKASF